MPALIKPTDEQLFGKDLLLTESGDLDVYSVNGFNDLKVISGRPNLRQAVLNRLRTGHGDMPQHKEYGSDIQLVMSEGMKTAKELAFKFVSAALGDEPRIREVVSTKFVDRANNAFDLEVVIKLQDSESPVNLIFPGFLK